LEKAGFKPAHTNLYKDNVMKKVFLLFLLFAFNAQAADFSPTPMTITVPPQIEYKFGGAPLEIPFTLTGKSGAVWLVINTHGQADKINAVRNGYLGWHYVNKIDTTIYISNRFERQPGENTITWDGRDENGNIPEPGEYDYYLWGYNKNGANELVSNNMQIGFGYFQQSTQLYEKDNQGLPLARPMLMGNFTSSDYYHKKDNVYREGTHFKWTIGFDPMDKSLIQTTFCSMYFPQLPQSFEHDYGTHIGYQLNPEYITYGGAAFDPKNYNIFYHPSIKVFPKDNDYAEYCTILKWTFVTGGDAILDNDWFGFDKALWEGPDISYGNACIATDNYIYISDSNARSYQPHNKLKCIDYDGEMVFDKSMNEWYYTESNGVVASNNNSIDRLYTRKTDRLLMLSTFSCMHQMINPSRLYEDQDDETDMVVFTNSNGDYFMDNGWQTNSIHPWYCISSSIGLSEDEFYSNQVKTSIAIDSNEFNFIFVRLYGIASFGISTQDGTGIGYMSFADDNQGESCIGGQVCDNGSAYDGIYFSKGPYDTMGYSTDKSQIFYVAFDSAHGMITNDIAVETKNPIQFKVNQNAPNPFNPSTTISFAIPEKGNVAIDIYNVAGQKIKTLVNGYMNAGEHSVKWDASGCSAGVYFYKVKAGKFERTMKMMLMR
jgi:flagellar hook assembly protein FlgD